MASLFTGLSSLSKTILTAHSSSGSGNHMVSAPWPHLYSGWWLCLLLCQTLGGCMFVWVLNPHMYLRAFPRNVNACSRELQAQLSILIHSWVDIVPYWAECAGINSLADSGRVEDPTICWYNSDRTAALYRLVVTLECKLLVPLIRTLRRFHAVRGFPRSV